MGAGRSIIVTKTRPRTKLSVAPAADAHVCAQCAASDKIYIDPRLVPRRPQISRETLENILSNPYSTYGMPDLNAQILQQYQQQGQPIVIPYGTGKVLVHPTKPLHSAIYSVTESEPDVSKVPAK